MLLEILFLLVLFFGVPVLVARCISYGLGNDESVAQQRAIEARNSQQPPLEGEPRLGDVMVLFLSITVLMYVLIDTAIEVLL